MMSIIISGLKAILSSEIVIIVGIVLSILGIKVANAFCNVIWLFSVLVGSGISFYFVARGISALYRNRK
ncbi:MAG: hypothetical protein ACP5UA_05075 [Candidatus Hydrogenedens sp.]